MPATLAQWLALLEQRHPRTIDLGLERCGAVYQAMGAPRPARTVITVGGTNGKGSTVAWSTRLARGLGLDTGSYTSPHILRFNERLAINELAVSDEQLVAGFEAVEAARGDVSLTYFEFTTLACLHLMAACDGGNGLDVAVLEVGLGGRLDTVNLVDCDVAVITAIGLDHQAFLGPDRDSIGAEKAGILRPGRPLVCAEPQPPGTVLARAAELDCPLYLAGRDFHWQHGTAGDVFEMDGWQANVPPLPLSGAHQFANLGAALAACRLALDSFGGVQAEAAVAGLASVSVPGRLQRSGSHPQVLLDVGHNPLAAEALAQALPSVAGGSVHCVLGMLKDKDAEGLAVALGPQVGHWYCASLGGERGQSAGALAARLQAAGVAGQVQASGTVSEALAAALAACEPPGHVLVLGSFETVAQALRALQSFAASASIR
jgi:dihydrofolate synthase/folylpolyglutamate synthase